MHAIDLEALEDWTVRAAQLIQDIVDEAQIAAGDPDGESECTDARALLSELDAVISGARLPHADDLNCPSCRGTGRDPMSDTMDWLPCAECGGSGILISDFLKPQAT